MRLSPLLAVAGVLSLAAGAARAQDVTTPRPGTGVFGGSGNDTARGASLDASLSVAGAYERNGRDLDDQPQSIFERTGAYEVITGDLTFATRGQRLQWGATGGTNLRYMNSSSEILRISDYGAVGLGARLGRRVTMSANQSATCGPLHFQGLLGAGGTAAPGTPTIAGTDYSLDRERACTFDTAGSVGLGLGRRSSVEFSAGTGRTIFGGGSGYSTLTSHTVGGQFLQNVSQRLRLRLRYARRTGDVMFQAGRGDRVLHDLDVGVDYQRPLSLTRRTYVDFNVGSTAVAAPPVVDRPQALQYRVVGDAGLNHEFGRTWRGRLGYNRGVDFVDGLTGPVLSNAVNATLNGFLTRRVDVNATVSVARGEVDAIEAASPFRARTASARVRYALARGWALYGEHTYYSYSVDASAVAFAVPPSLNRHAARVGLTWWIPLLGR